MTLCVTSIGCSTDTQTGSPTLRIPLGASYILKEALQGRHLDFLMTVS